jgi:6-phosphogluconolactonase
VNAAKVARWIASILEDGGAVALSGGSTPEPVYRALADEALAWDRIHWFFGDERFVPPDSPESNYRMAREAMLYRAPPANVRPVPTLGVTLEDAAARYEAGLPKRFRLVLLGIGTDGHTASLFPGSPVLEERVRGVRAVPEKSPPRITLTYPALENADHVAFLVSGADKDAVLERVLAGDVRLPAARVRPKGELRFFTDND